MSGQPAVIVIHETVLKSWAKDAGTFALFASMIGVGWFVDSTALQWVGAIIAFCVIVAKASGAQKRGRMTIPQARLRLDELEAGR